MQKLARPGGKLGTNRLAVAPFAEVQVKGDTTMTDTAVLSTGNIKHGVTMCVFLDARKDVRMANLTSIPQDVFLMGEDDVGHPGALRCDGKILLCFHGFPFDRYPIKIINRHDERFSLCLFPVDKIPGCLSR